MYEKDRRVFFENPNEWVMTDPDTYQFARKVNDTTWEYYQLSNDKIMKLLNDVIYKNQSIDPTPLKDRVLNYINNHDSFKTTSDDWYCGEIDLDDYDADEICDYLSAYGDSYLQGADENTKVQLTCEAIFETDMFTEFNPLYH